MALRKDGFWDEHYGLELKNYQEDGDEGEVWFGKGLSRRIADWLVDKLITRSHDGVVSNIVDVGCGNSFTLCTLVEKYKTKSGNRIENIDNLMIIGIDYSLNSIDLSKKIVTDRNLSDRINLEQCDFLNLEQLRSASGGEKFNFIIDIGTFDAICLLASHSPDSLEDTKLKYMESLYSLVKVGSIFILASCNHTEEELMSLFDLKCPSRYNSKLIDRIETPKLKFGGHEGSQVTCVILEFLDHHLSER